MRRQEAEIAMQTHLTVKGAVIRESVYGEADKLFDLLTENGILTVRARSVRKQGSKYAAAVQLFVYGEYCLRKSGERWYLDSAAVTEQFYGLRSDLTALSLAGYFSEVIRHTATQQRQPQILRLFLYCLHYLSAGTRSQALIKAVFELRLMTELGTAPNLVCCEVCAEYLPEKPVMRIAEADFVCADCLHEQESGEYIAVTASALQAARHIVFSEFDRLFLFRLGENSMQGLSRYTERYLNYTLGRSFQTQQFYRTLIQSEGQA